MDIQSINQASLLNAYNQHSQNANLQQSKSDNAVVNNENFTQKDSTFHNVAVDLSISMESIKVFINLKSVEFTKDNTSAQNAVVNLRQNEEVYKFLSGEKLENGFSLSSIGYEGKPIVDLTTEEAQDLVSDEGFFGVTQTSERVSSFVIGLAGDNLEALQEARSGIVQGFEEAEKMWGGELPEISYQTQEKTLDFIDKKIAEMLKTDAQKELEVTTSTENEEK